MSVVHRRMQMFFRISCGGVLQSAGCGLVCGVLFLSALVSVTRICMAEESQDVDTGRIEFLSKCAECHGADGKGAGPKSNKLNMKPANLTILAKTNNGVFSTKLIYQKIDGRSAIGAHRRSEMPIWGCRHGSPPSRQTKSTGPRSIDSLLDLPCDPEETIRRRILNVVEYLATIQQK
jgi:mono/diheme cytochrome c family protein